MSDGNVNDPPQPSGGAPDPEGNPNPEQQRDSGLTLEALQQELDKRDQKWAAQLRTALKARPEPSPEPKPDPEPEPETEPGDKPRSVADKKRDAAIATLKQELADERAERKKEAERRASDARDQRLRARIGKEDVRDVEATYRIVRAGLSIDEEGEFTGEVDGAPSDVDGVLKATLKDMPWLKKPVDRDGGGGTPPAASGPQQKGGDYDESKTPGQNMLEAFEAES